jgi:hypothetical protein
MLGAFLLSGCEHDAAPPAAGDAATDVTAPAVTGEARSALRVARLDPDMPSVNVDRLLRNPRDHAGTMAVEGVVVQCFEDRGAFVVVDVEEFKTCGLEACTDAAMPVRFTRDRYEGSLPQPGQMVTLIGHFEPLDRGFRFDLHEVHLEGSVILAQRPAEGS